MIINRYRPLSKKSCRKLLTQSYLLTITSFFPRKTAAQVTSCSQDPWICQGKAFNYQVRNLSHYHKTIKKPRNSRYSRTVAEDYKPCSRVRSSEQRFRPLLSEATSMSMGQREDNSLKYLYSEGSKTLGKRQKKSQIENLMLIKKMNLLSERNANPALVYQMRKRMLFSNDLLRKNFLSHEYEVINEYQCKAGQSSSDSFLLKNKL